MSQTSQRSDSEASTGVVQSVDRAISLMECFTRSHPIWSVSALSRKSGVSKATVHRLLNTLEMRGFIDQDQETKEYRLGLKLLDLGSRVSAVLDPARIAEPHLRALVDDLGETAHLAVLHEQRALYVAKVEGRHALRMPSAVGSSNPLHCTAVGKVLLAFQPDAFIEATFSGNLTRYTPNTITQPVPLRKELDKVRRSGIAIDNEERELGLRCIAAPVYDHRGEVAAAISVSGPVTRMSVDHEEELILRIGRAAKDAGADLGAEAGTWIGAR